MKDKRVECGCHRVCTSLPHECTRPCRWPNCLTEDEHAELLADLAADPYLQGPTLDGGS